MEPGGLLKDYDLHKVHSLDVPSDEMESGGLFKITFKI